MIESLFGPVGKEKFLSEYFEKNCLLQRNVHDFSDLFSIIDFDRYLISGEGRLHNLVRISKNGERIVLPFYEGQSTTQREFVLEQFKQGATLKLEDLDFRCPAIAHVCKELEEVFGGHVFAKPFLTGPNSSGLAPHFDTTEVFVVQLEGQKTWQVWDKLVDSPTQPMQKILNENALGNPVIETTLSPNDVLYIPAGTPHAAKCLDDYSLHLAIGLQPLKLCDVLEGYIRIVSEHVRDLRQNVFPFSPMEELDRNALSLLERMSRVKFSDMLNSFSVAYHSTKHETCDTRLKSLAQLHKIGKDTTLKVRSGSKLKKIKDKDHVFLYFSSTLSPGKPLISSPLHMKLPDYCDLDLDSLLSFGNEAFTPGQLSGKLDLESKVLLCEGLVNAGIVVTPA